MEIILDEKQWGKVKQDSSLPLFNFYYLNMDNEKQFITQRHGNILVAVTQQQFNNWKHGRTVICEEK